MTQLETALCAMTGTISLMLLDAAMAISLGVSGHPVGCGFFILLSCGCLFQMIRVKITLDNIKGN